MINYLFFFLAGLILLVVSSDWLIQSSVKLSLLFKLTPLFIGLIVVALGTSAPEGGVGIMAAIRNQKSIALGNIVGSNIANIGLILGVCALCSPLKINKRVFKTELPIMIFAVALLYVLSLDLCLSRVDGAIFILCFIIFTLVSYKNARRSFDENDISDFKFRKVLRKIDSRPVIFCITLISIAGVICGADLMVKGGVGFAGGMGISPWIIAITVFSVGTSLPELVASVTASFKKVPSISVGNVIGSNIFNILLVLGVVSLIRPIPVRVSYLGFEYLVLICFSLALFLFMETKYKMGRLEGFIMLLGYILFIVFLVL